MKKIMILSLLAFCLIALPAMAGPPQATKSAADTGNISKPKSPVVPKEEMEADIELEDEWDNAPSVSYDPMKTKAKVVLCWDFKNKTTYNCYSKTECEELSQQTATVNGVSITVTCPLDCTGISPDNNGNCDCPREKDKDGFDVPCY